MNAIIGVVLAILVYPGALAALLAGEALGWVRGAARGAARGDGGIGGAPGIIREIGSAWREETAAPEGMHPAVLTLCTWAAMLFPLLALIFLPVPGNPLVGAIGLTGDLATEAALLLGMPLARLLLGWATPSPYTRLAADRGARALAGAILPMALALGAIVWQLGTLRLDGGPANNGLSLIALVARVLAAAAFACALPVLARATVERDRGGESELLAGEATELTGRDLFALRLGEALQIVAAAGLFVAAFILPIFAGVTNLVARDVIWVVGLLVVAAGIGAWEGWRARRGTAAGEAEGPPLTWWLGAPVLIALVALVVAAWASRFS